MCILRSLCVYYNLYVYTTISMMRSFYNEQTKLKYSHLSNLCPTLTLWTNAFRTFSFRTFVESPLGKKASLISLIIKRCCSREKHNRFQNWENSFSTFYLSFLLSPCYFFLISLSLSLSLIQCDKMENLVFNFLPLTTMKMGPIPLKIGPKGSNFCQILNKLSKDRPNNFLPKWWNFTKSSHTAIDANRLYVRQNGCLLAM